MQRLVWWVQWHRRLGTVVAVLVFALALTGILINHSQDMGWHREPVYSKLLAWLYHIPLHPVEQGYRLGERWLTQVGEQLYLDHVPLSSRCPDSVRGAVQVRDMLAVLCGTRLLLLEEGELIEQLSSLPAQPQALAVRDDVLLLQSGEATLAFDEERASWSPVGPPARWAQQQMLPQELRTFLNERNPVPGLSRERVLLDLHSGRLFGIGGVVIVDLVGVATCLLAFSGLLTWIGRKLRHRRRH